MTNKNRLEGMLEGCKKNPESGHCSFMIGFGGAVWGVGVSFLHGLAYSKGDISASANCKFLYTEAMYTGISTFGFALFSPDLKGAAAATGTVIALEAAAFGAGYGLGYMLK